MGTSAVFYGMARGVGEDQTCYREDYLCSRSVEVAVVVDDDEEG